MEMGGSAAGVVVSQTGVTISTGGLLVNTGGMTVSTNILASSGTLLLSSGTTSAAATATVSAGAGTFAGNVILGRLAAGVALSNALTTMEGANVLLQVRSTHHSSLYIAVSFHC